MIQFDFQLCRECKSIIKQVFPANLSNSDAVTTLTLLDLSCATFSIWEWKQTLLRLRNHLTQTKAPSHYFTVGPAIKNDSWILSYWFLATSHEDSQSMYLFLLGPPQLSTWIIMIFTLLLTTEAPRSPTNIKPTSFADLNQCQLPSKRLYRTFLPVFAQYIAKNRSSNVSLRATSPVV